MNGSQQLRLSQILSEIRRGKYPTAEQLAAQMQVHLRTIRRDLELLSNLNAPVYFDRTRRGWAISEPMYALPSHFLTHSETTAIRVGEMALHQNPNSPFAQQLTEGSQRMTQTLEPKVRESLDSLPERLSFQPAFVPLESPDILETLTTAIEKERTVELEYWAASTETITRRHLDPYHLACRGGAWYLYGYCQLRRESRLFAVSRVKSIRMLEEYFERPKNFDIHQVFDQAFLLIAESERDSETIVLKCDSSIAKYIRDKRWHSSQTIQEHEDGSIEVRFQLGSLIEIRRWVLSWGEGIEVLAPSNLRQMILEEAMALAERHRSPSSSSNAKSHAPSKVAKAGASKPR